ncbi:MAG: chemotaxis protein CheW [Acetobacteraceae bacterium]
MPKAEASSGTAGLVVQVAGGRWAIPLANVVEVLRETRLIRVPGGVPAVRGMVNHRGRILTVADAVRALELSGDSGGAGDVVVVQWEQRRFGVAVDAVVELKSEARTGLAEMDLGRIALAIFA